MMSSETGSAHRRWALGLSISLVLLLHTTAVWTVGSEPPERFKFSAGPVAPTVVTTRSIMSRSAEAEHVEVESTSTRARIARRTSSGAMDGSNSVAPATPAAAALPAVPVLDLSRFLPLDAVDTPAMPQEDWHVDQQLLQVLDEQAALQNEHVRLIILILIDANGATRQCSLDEPADLDVKLARQLEDQLCSTPMAPAMRRGAPVGSVRKIEMIVGQ